MSGKNRELERLREFQSGAARMPWRKTSSPRYKTCPHEYVIRSYEGRGGVPRNAWDELAAVVKRHGSPRNWRSYQYTFLSVDGYVYWVVGEALNRTYESALENGGWPSQENQRLIQKRFGRGGDNDVLS